MARVVYEIVEHDGGWAYRLGGAYSETFPDHDRAKAAALKAAAEQRVGGATTGIRYQGPDGAWHDEIAEGGDRPSTEVVG